MSSIGLVLIIFGVLTVLFGLAGFVDTRTVDRRFKTGYKNNEADSRNFGRSARRVVYGVGMIVIGAAVKSIFPPAEHVSSARVDTTVSSSPTVQAPASESSSVDPLDSASATGSADVDFRQASNEQAAATETLPQTADPVEQEEAPPQTRHVFVACVEDGTYFGANVCKNRALADAYNLEVKEYEAAQARIGGKDLGVRAEQEAWLERVTRTCIDMACLDDAFDNRIADLRARYRREG